MKAVLISIQPKWCELIASGKKTVEVRKTAPKEVPFKAYIYCTKDKHYEIAPIQFSDGLFIKHISENTHWANGCTSNIGEILNGKVIGEFVCDKVEQYEANERGWYIYPQDEVCMWTDEIAGYGKGKPLYGWHISELKIYDEPKELIFNKPCPIKWRNCPVCEFYSSYTGCCCNQVKRSPQSWCYVEDTIYE